MCNYLHFDLSVNNYAIFIYSNLLTFSCFAFLQILASYKVILVDILIMYIFIYFACMKMHIKYIDMYVNCNICYNYDIIYDIVSIIICVINHMYKYMYNIYIMELPCYYHGKCMMRHICRARDIIVLHYYNYFITWKECACTLLSVLYRGHTEMSPDGFQVEFLYAVHVLRAIQGGAIEFWYCETAPKKSKFYRYVHYIMNHDTFQDNAFKIRDANFLFSKSSYTSKWEYALISVKRKFYEIKSGIEKVKFIIDSGCSSHITNVNIKHMYQVEHIHTLINTAGGLPLRSTVKGCIGPLKHVLNVPLAKYSLLSVSNICDEDFTVVFTKDEVLFIHNNDIGDTLHKAHIHYKGLREGNLYVTHIDTSVRGHDLTCTSANAYSLVADAIPVNRYTLWHHRLNHCSHEVMVRLRESKSVKDLSWDDNEYIAHRSKVCHGCVMGKMLVASTRKRSRELINERHPSNRPGGLILVDLFFSNIVSHNSCELGMIIVDAYSKCMWSIFGRSKDEAETMFQTWISLMKGLKFQVSNVSKVRSDNGGEFISNAFMNMLSTNGITHERAPPYAHVNRAERAIRHVKETARSYINTNYCNMSRLAAWKTRGRTSNPFIFWTEAVKHACAVFNSLPEKKLAPKGLSRHERFFGERPDYTRLKVFGCTAYVHISRELRKSFDNTSLMGVYLGFNPLSPQTWRIMSIQTGNVVESRSVLFNENVDEQNIPAFVRGGGSQDNAPDEYWQDSAELSGGFRDNPSTWETLEAREETYVATVKDVESTYYCMNSLLDCDTSTRRVPNSIREAKSSQ